MSEGSAFSDPILAEMATINFKFFWLSYNY